MEIIHEGRRYLGVDPAGAADLGIPPEVVAAAQLADARARALRDIDVAAAAARGRHATTAAGQDGVYQIKADQAQAWLTAGQPEDASPWALLTVEAAARGMTVPALVAEIIATRDAWIAILAQIEGARMAGKDAVRAASAVAVIDAARAVALSTLKGI